MTSVEQLIGNLLLRHNCVIIPSFGGFVAKRVSARIDYNSGTMLPPSKSILFNRQLLNNDGLLINEFALENGVSYDEASKELDSLVQDWQSALKEGGRIEIERVGNLYFDDERNICFEQDRFANLLLESFGLGSVHFVSEEDVRLVEETVTIAETTPIVESAPIELPKKQEESQEIKVAPSLRDLKKREETPIVPITAAKIEKKEVSKSPKEEAPKPKKNRAWRYVAAACILPIAFYSVWIPVKTDVMESGMISFSDFNPFHNRAEAAYEPAKKTAKGSNEKPQSDRTTLQSEVEDLQSDTKVYTYQFTEDTYIKVALPEVDGDRTESTNPEQNSEPTNPATEPTFEANSMHFIVGCFGDKTNADNLVAKLRASGLDGAIVDVQGGLHRVTAGGAISEEAYQTIKLKAEAIGLSGWRLR